MKLIYKQYFVASLPQAHRQIDCENSIIAPGYIELQINGKQSDCQAMP